MTVSRVLNAEGNVAEETLQRVNASIKVLRYAPSQIARSLATSDMVRVGLLYANSTSAYFNDLLLGSLEQSSLSGCQLLPGKCEDFRSVTKAVQHLIAGKVDGIILPPPLCDSEQVLMTVARAGISAVLITSGQRQSHFSTISVDDYKAAKDMTCYLIRLGHRRISFIAGHSSHSSAGLRLQGYREGMNAAGLTVNAGQIAQGAYTYRSGLQAADTLLSGGFRPTAIFACNDEMAAATLAVAHRKGIEVPGDLAVAGFDDAPFASMIWPRLTTVRRPISAMAREAVQLLVTQTRRMRMGQHEPVKHIQLDYDLIERESSCLQNVTDRAEMSRRSWAISL